MKLNFSTLWKAFKAAQLQTARLESFRSLSTDQLKALWDAFDPDAEAGEPGYFWPADGPHIEDVHRLLSERGEGNYCAA